MITLPAILLTLSGISGAGGLALSVKSTIDSLEVSSKNRFIQDKNEKNVLKFESVSEKLEDALNDLGKQRITISKNFSVFINAFEKIKNKPDFIRVEGDILPEFSFEEIRNVSIVAEMALGGTGGFFTASFLGVSAAQETAKTVIYLGRASTGTKIAKLHGMAKANATLAALGGGSLKAGGGGMVLGSIVLDATTLGIGALVQGIALAYTSSLAKKKTDKAAEQVDKNETLIDEAIKLQMSILHAIEDIKKASVHLCNTVYKPLVFKMRDLVNREDDWNNYNEEEKKLIENNIHIVQILNYLNNTPMYKVVKQNEKGEVEEVEANTEEVREAIKTANDSAERMCGCNVEEL